jgi:hypothetical protein
MHELDRVCHFVMGFLTWAECKLEENWLASLSKAIMKVEGFSNVGQGEKYGVKKRTNSPIKRHTMKGNGTMGKTFQKGKNPNNFKAQALNQKEN